MNTPTYTYGERQFNDYENPFAFSTETETRPAASANNYRGGGLPTTTSGSMYEPKASSIGGSSRRQQWNTILRFATFFSAVGAVILLVVFGHEDIQSDPISNVVARYSDYTAFKFLLWVNVVTAFYALVLGLMALVMRRQGLYCTPSGVMSTVVFLNVLVGSLLLVAFASALSVELVNRNGTKMFQDNGKYFVTWEGVCGYLGIKMFCSIIEAALACSILGYITIIASTCFDVYDIYHRDY